MFDRHKWFYNPFDFSVARLDQNTIDNFVEETPISKEMTNKMVLYHQEQEKVRQQKKKENEKKKKDEKRDAVVNKRIDHFEKSEKIYKYGVGGGILWRIIMILQFRIIILK